MKTVKEIREIARKGLEKVIQMDNVRDAEVMVTRNSIDYVKLNYTSDILCNGIEQPLKRPNEGVGVRFILEDGRFGAGAENHLSVDGVVNAAGKAFKTAHEDPFITSLPLPMGEATLVNYHDPEIIYGGPDKLIEIAGNALRGALDTFREVGYGPNDQLILNGDVTTIREDMALVSSTGMDVTDVSTIVMAFLTAMNQKTNSKGTGIATASSFAEFNTYEAGREAALNAINGANGYRIDTGDYDVIFAPAAVTDLVQHFIEGDLKAGRFAKGITCFGKRFGQQITSPVLTIYDDGAKRGAAASKGYTGEGIPTGRTPLITEGMLVGLLSTYEDTKLFHGDSNHPKVVEAREIMIKCLGTDEIPELNGRSGFRFGRGGGRSPASSPYATGTNMYVQGINPMSEEELLQQLENGIYIGKIWYTYPIRGYSKGDFTSTIIADSFIVEDGKKVAPLRPNIVRITDNVPEMLMRVEAVGDTPRDTIMWGSESIVHTPPILVRGVTLNSIAEFMDRSTDVEYNT